MARSRSKRTLFRRLLRWAGVDSRARSAELIARLARAENRVTLTRQLRDYARASMLRWKERNAMRKERELRWIEEIKRLKAQAERTRALELEVARLTAALGASEREKLRRVEQIEALVAATEQLAHSGREQLNTIEVKLDLLDGALNTLDRRYRAIVTRGTGTGV